MKKYIFSVICIAAAIFSATNVFAQGALPEPGHSIFGDALQFSKKVTAIDQYNYTIDIEAFVTGETKTITEEYHKPIDAILVLDVSASMETTMGRTSRLDALKKAVSTFLTTLATDSKLKDGEHHKVSIIKYACNIPGENSKDLNGNPVTIYGNDKYFHEYNPGVKDYKANYTQIVSDLGNISNDNLDELKNKVNSLSSNGATRADYGMQLAGIVAEKETDSERPIVIIMFTDGEPGDRGFDSEYSDWQPGAYPTAVKTIGESYKLKQKGATVYTIGVFESISENTPTSWYMNYVSSNYKNAQKGFSFTETKGSLGNSTKGNDGKYYRVQSYNKIEWENVTKESSTKDSKEHFFNTTDASELSKIFETIAEESTKGGSKVDLDAKTTTVVDIVSADFKLPSDITQESHSKVKVYYAKTIGREVKDGKDDFKFETKVSLDTVTVNIGKDASGNDQITLGNFDFAKNYVSEKFKENGDPTEPRTFTGGKIILSFPIEIDPESEGGASVATNTIQSGIYKDGKQVATFELPTVKIPNILIVKDGLHKGESAIFKVTGEGSTFYAVITGDKGVGDSTRIKIQKAGRYTVEEQAWSWAYTPSAVTEGYDKDDNNTSGSGATLIRNVNADTEDTTAKATIFKFKNSDKASTPAHGEDIENNRFVKKAN